MKTPTIILLCLLLSIPAAAKLAYTFSPTDYGDLLAKECSFIAGLQVTTPGADFGGMREGEQLLDIIQTDNTTESVWVWSYYHDLTGLTTYSTNLANAWTYVTNHPGWLEEGGSDPIGGYYRVYVSAWGPIADMMYEDSYSDSAHRSYSDTCAQYIADNPLNMTQANCKVQNTLVEAWGVGSLYLYADRFNNTAWKNAALNMANQIKANVESSPVMYLNNKNWAMSGGTVMWGLLNSYFKAHPSEKLAWVNTYAPYLSDYEPVGNWNNAHNAWYALGHIAAYAVNNDPAEYTSFRFLRLRLLSQDTDDDGGIPSQEDHASNADESWVANYQVYMTFLPGSQYEVGVNVIGFMASNNPRGIKLCWNCETQPGIGFDIMRREGEGKWEAINPTPIKGSYSYSYIDDAVGSGVHYSYSLLCDGLTIAQTELTRNQPATTLSVKPMQNPVQSNLTLVISGVSGTPANLSIYDISGKLVHHTVIDAINGTGSVYGLDLAGCNISSPGIYLVKVRQANVTATTKFILK
jgi:hypothetical protein